jgi:hypothetical protein
MVSQVSSAQPGFFLDIIRIQNLQGGRIAVPVHPAQAAYARFKHIQGVPAPEGGAPIFRLRVLDNLIDRLLRYGHAAPAIGQPQSLGEAVIDPLIGRLQGLLHAHLLRVPPSFGGLFPETGMLIDLTA